MIVIKSHAKVNWFLRILDRRPDGYHNLETVFQEIGLCDQLSFETSTRPECQITGFPDDVPAQSNLITKAWHLLRSEFPDRIGGIQVVAQKEIPRGGGLGGGSSNAAATLNAVNALFELKLSPTQLGKYGASIGSDVPFFMSGGCAIGRGRGEQLTPIKHELKCQLVLVFPGVHVSTAEAYKKLSSIRRSPPPAGVESVVKSLDNNDLTELSRAIYNDFEHVIAEFSWFSQIKTMLEKAGCSRVFLCGSGSTVAGLVSDGGQIEQVLEYLHDNCAYSFKGCGLN